VVGQAEAPDPFFYGLLHHQLRRDAAVPGEGSMYMAIGNFFQKNPSCAVKLHYIMPVTQTPLYMKALGL